MSADIPHSSIDGACDEVKLAVDLIYLFESQNIDPQVALSALEIVASDLKAKLAKV
ncbi:pleiotropic regulatory protein RsmS [Shewanella sp. D64]|uniref:pleiotropic regulatory protein RsmS n=1 Tax=unclassified Shewanella TaxID=196818 RepID=UPI0022BA59A4|nr:MULTISPECIES: pleiotropic regulatory protein RsmS [unclassified Shewanella]MEC4728629.1 pleiotropic regulatory protein RsmS [Shewanella sp. D64]MEC4737878.1 pleiotropic regulatory protein RsmS [Shewanella sp. E94]WBJ93869.1 pleiotropic regulatory protein RsmS [Shewanella sp. MTB7]